MMYTATIALEYHNLIFSIGIRVILCHLTMPNLFVFVIGDINDDKRVNYFQNFWFCIKVEFFN